MSDIDGLFDADPHTCTNAKTIPLIDEITEAVVNLAGGTGTRFGTGGMVTKLKAAKRVINAGHQMVLANGEDPKIIFDILAGKSIGTLFAADC